MVGVVLLFALSLVISPAMAGLAALPDVFARSQSDETYLADVIVTTTADSGAGSLRQAIVDVGAGETITFAPALSGQTITLTSGELVINKNLTIDGSGLANQVTISGGSASRVFNISTAGNTVILNNLTIANGAFAGNGGGIYNNGSTLTVSACNFNHNNASAGNGGAIYNNTSGLLTASECNFNGNSAGQGGAIYTNQGHVNLDNSAFSGNSSASHGSVLYSFFGSAITVTIANSSFYSNSVTEYNSQAAIYVRTNLVVKNSTFSGNRSWNRVVDISDFANCGTPACTIQLGNNIFANVASGTGHVAGGGGTYIDLGHNIVDTNESVTFNSPSSQLNTNPLLDSWANNGGSTPTFALLPGSPAIDAGDSATCAGLPGGDLDQRGKARVGTCDIGSFESGGFTLAISGGNNQSTRIGTAFPAKLQVTVTSNATPAEPVNGGQVTFAGPLSGAGVTPITQTATIMSGAASVTATANTTGGSYLVAANTNGATAGVSFSLANNLSIDLAVTQSYQLSFLNNITFTLTARNLGPDAAPNAVVSDTFPSGSTTWNWDCTPSGGATCTASGSGNISDTLTNFPSGRVVTYTVLGTLANWYLRTASASFTCPNIDSTASASFI